MDANGPSMESHDESPGIGETRIERSCVSVALSSINKEAFDDWYRAREFRQNIRDGKPYFNGASTVPHASRHSPSSLLQCHRKIVYQQENAPEERRNARGILWTGQEIEEKVVVPFLQDVVATDEIFIRNSVWIDFAIETKQGDLRIKGVTDPVLVDEESTPLLPTEIKTTSSLDYLDGPKPHHVAQLHAYQVGLSRKYDLEVTEGVLVYVSRESLELEAFHVEFNAEFWEETVVKWAVTHSDYRLNDKLPPDEPEQSWECKFCSYRERCGKGTSKYADVGVLGFVPQYREYPREKVVEYLESRDDAQLTPALANTYPELAEEYDVVAWECPRCCAAYTIGDTRFQETVEQPLCPDCAAEDSIVELRPPVTVGEK